MNGTKQFLMYTRKIAIAAGILLIVAVVAVVSVSRWLEYIFLPDAENSARYYPDDTIAYAWLTLYPGFQQVEHVSDMWDRLQEIRSFRQLEDGVTDDLDETTGIDFENDIASWIGTEISGAVVNLDSTGVPVMVAMIRVRDSDSATEFMADWIEFLEDERGADFDWNPEGEFETWLDERGDQHWGLSDEWMVFATTENALEDMVNRISKDTNNSLSSTVGFKDAMSQLPPGRFASAYINLQRLLDESDQIIDDDYGILDFVGNGDSFDEGAGNGDEPLDWVATSMSWVKRGLVMESVFPARVDDVIEIVDVKPPVEKLPADTLAFVAGTFDPILDHWRSWLGKLDSSAFTTELADSLNETVIELSTGKPPLFDDESTWSDALDIGLWLLEDITDIDFEHDFIAHLDGSYVLAVRDFNYSANSQDVFDEEIDIVGMLSHRKDREARLATTMDDVEEFIEDQLDLKFRSIDISSEDEARVLDWNLNGTEADYLPGYLIHAGYLVLGSTRDVLEAMVEIQEGKRRSILDIDEYRRTVEHLSGNGQLMLYIDLQKVINHSLIPDVESDVYEVLREILSGLAIKSSMDGDYNRTQLVLTLFPE